MKAAIYVRVSTDIQAREGFSIVAQIKLIREYCTKNDIEIIKEYCDEGLSAKHDNINKRPALQEMLKDGEKGLFDTILVHKYDRFARNVELSQRVKKQLSKANIKLISITEPLEDSPMGFFVGGIHELLSEYYIRNLSKEVKKGMNERASQGLYMGRLPYGYYLDNKVIKVNEHEADTVKKVFELYNSGMGTAKISRILNELKIPQQYGGCNWQCFPVRKILHSKSYIGTMCWNGEEYENVFPRIIDDEVFQLTQMQLEQRGTTFTQRKKHYDEFVLLGVLRCDECGATMRVKENNKKKSCRKWVYICSHAANKKTRCTHTAYHDINAVEKAVDKYIFNDLLKQYDFSDHQKTIDNNDILYKRLDKINKDLEKALQCFYNEVFTMEEYKIQKDNLTSLKGEIEAELSRSKEDKAAIFKDRYKNKLMSMKDRYYSTEDIVGKKNIIIELVESITISSEDEIKIIPRY